MPFSFGPAQEGESIVFGAKRPGHPATKVGNDQVNEWVAYMKEQGVERVCCLLANAQLDHYNDLLGTYRSEFGTDNVCSAPVRDRRLCDLDTLRKKILPFLCDSVQTQKKVVVHCSGGSGRTGHVTAAWLVHANGMGNEEALATAERVHRNPREAVQCGNATMEELNALLDACRDGHPEEAT